MNLKNLVLKIVCVIISMTKRFQWQKDFDVENILIDEKSHENIFIHDISYRTLIGSNPLRIRFDKIDGFIRIYDATIYLTLFGSEKYDAIYDRIKYLISLKSGITYIFSSYFAEIIIVMILYQ